MHHIIFTFGVFNFPTFTSKTMQHMVSLDIYTCLNKINISKKNTNVENVRILEKYMDSASTITPLFCMALRSSFDFL